MRRSSRLALVIVFVASAAVTVIALSSIGSASEGPLSTALGWLGAATGAAEHHIRDRLSGPGRRETLRWLDAYRTSATKLRAPDIVLLGAYDSDIPQSLDGVLALESRLRASLAIMQVYSAWGDKPDEQFPLKMLSAIEGLGSIPMVTWEPWLTDFVSGKHPSIPLRDARDRHGLAAVAAGTYDFYIDAWAAEAARFGKPFFLRFAHEMNDPYRYPWGPQNNTKEEYILAWRHVVERFRSAGATNVIWVWSPHVAYEYWDLYYPGARYVDWVATGVLNFGPIAQWSQWWTFGEIFGTKYPRLASFGKPVMVAELGSLAVGGDRSAWYKAALDSLPSRYPAVRAVVFFHARDDQTVTYQKVDWTIVNDSSLATVIRESLDSTGLACPRQAGCKHR